MNKETILKEMTFKATRSSGAGGQHVNKVSSKVELYFDIENSFSLSESEKELLLKKLSTRVTKDGVLQLSSDESRSQHRNKEIVIKRFLLLIAESLTRPKKRRPTKPSRSSVVKNAEKNRKHTLKKSLRKKPGLE
jgi:ribosome-associated protein